MHSHRPDRHWPRTAALLLLLATNAAAEDQDTDVRFLLGRWSVDCALGQLVVYEQNGRLMQQGFLNLANMPELTNLPLPPGGGLPATPLIVARKGARMVAKAADGPIQATGLVHVQSTDALYVDSIKVCFGEQCQEQVVRQEVRRCGG